MDICAGYSGPQSTSVRTDFSGHARAEIAVFDSGFWAIDDGDYSWSGCGVDLCAALGQAGDLPAPGRW